MIFTATLRRKMDRWLVEDVFGKEQAEFILYKNGPSFAHSEPTLAFWWLALKIELIAFTTASIAWALMFKLAHMNGPAWLTHGSYSVAGVFAVQTVAYILYAIAEALTDPADPGTMPPEDHDLLT